jgi:hypothetical protein
VAAPATGSAYFFSKATAGPSGGGTIFKSGVEFKAAHQAGPPAGGVPFATFAEGDGGSGTGAVSWGDTLDDTRFHLISLRRLTAYTLAIRVDELSEKKASTSTVDINQVGSDLRIGSVSYGTVVPTIDFEIAELVVVHPPNGIVLDSDVICLRGYLKAKYGL